MINTINNGGPAFPLPAVSHQGHVVALTEGPALGMTLRDYLAAKAMQGMLAAAERGSNADIAKYAYKVADAMLCARGEA